MKLAPLLTAICSAISQPCVAAMSAQSLDPSSPLQLLIPEGEFTPRDGRVLPVKSWVCEKADGLRVIAAFRARSVELPIDYEHQILYAIENGKEAPAAGWIADLEWNDDLGLMAKVRWTAKAKAAIDADEYRYWSPVFSYDGKTGRVLQLLHAGLTNTPALDLPALSLRAAARFAPAPTTGETPTMDLAKMRELLGLPADADEAAIMAAITKLKAKADDADTAVAAARAQAKPDPAQYVPLSVVTELRTEVAALRATQTESEVTALVNAGIADGRILPAMKDWATELGTSNVASLKAYLAKQQPIAALAGTQTGGQAPATVGDTGLTADELAVCSVTGTDPEAFKKHKAAATGGAK